MESKPWYLSKVIWTCIVTIIVSAYNIAASTFPIQPIPEFVYAILAAIGVYSRKVANTTIQ